MVAGLRHIINNPNSGSPPYHICLPTNIAIPNYVAQTLELLPQFVLSRVSDIGPDDVLIENYGEPIRSDGYLADHECFVFLRNLFLKAPYTVAPSRKLYIRRSRAHLCEGNAADGASGKRRHIVNEDELCASLQEVGIESIFLEDYTVAEKIAIFGDSLLVIAPNSGALVFSLFAHPDTQIIEINTTHPHQVCEQYKHICNRLGIKHMHYRNVIKVDCLDNMYVDVSQFMDFLGKLSK